MELRHIRYFLALAQEGNFTRAAAKVGIAQSPFSAQIRDLEREIGAQLFHRVPHGADLTSAGHAFSAGVLAIPGLVDRASHAARRAARGETGSLAIGFTASSAFNAVVPGTIRAFCAAYPDVDVSLEEANTTRLVSGLENGTLDAAFLRPGGSSLDGLKLRLLSDEPLVVALPSAHAASDAASADLAQLGDTPLLLFPRAMGPVLHDTITGAFRMLGLEPMVDQTAPQIASLINLVAAGMGMTLVPASMAQMAVAGVVFLPITGNAPTVSIALATRRPETNPMIRNLLSIALQ